MTTTTDPPNLEYSYDAETGIRWVTNPKTGIWGAGPTPLDALRDYDQAVLEHADLERRLATEPPDQET